MNPTTDSDSPTEAFRLEGALDIYAAEKLRETLQGCMTTAGVIVLDLGGVESCDTTGVQLLLSAQRTASEAGRTLHFEAIPAAVGRCCERLGLPESIITYTS